MDVKQKFILKSKKNLIKNINNFIRLFLCFVKKCYLYLEGIFRDSLHPENILFISVTLLVFHFDISGNDDNDEHPENIYFIFVTLLVFHVDISGNDDNEEHPSNIVFISVTL